MTDYTSCPRCTSPYPTDRPALSRTDNKTPICPSCGTDEAMMDWTNHPLPQPHEWPLEYLTSSRG